MKENSTILPWKNAILETKKKLVANMELKKNQKVLVVCCGIGTEAFMIKELISPGGYVLGIDINRDAIDIAMQRKEEYGQKGIDFLVKDAQNIEEYFNFFDKVCCIFGMHYFENRLAIMEHWSKCIKPGGQLAIAEWTKSDSNPVIDDINNVVRNYLSEGIRSANSSNSRNKYQTDFSLEKAKVLNMSFEFPYGSTSDYWETFKKNDLFHRVEKEIGKKKFKEMERDISELVEVFKEEEIIEVKKVRISFIQL